MATYIALVNFTDQGVRQIRQTTERAKGLVNAAANLGIKIKDIYWTMGAFDAVFFADAADDEAMTAVDDSMVSLGNIGSLLMRDFSEWGLKQILASHPTIDIS